ncbi:MAG: hypothetical protein WAL56_18895 [Candidatus Sulfotelmatobacter sp.]
MHLLDASGKYRDTTIDLRTRAGNPIPNTQVWELSRYDWHVLGESLSRFKNAERVSEACPVYNCHGLTFGSRRTQVGPPILSILDDDGFDQILSEKDVRPGDIVVYSNARGEVAHSGFVVWRKKIELVGGIVSVIPMVWSKWGKGYEVIHAVAECPYFEDEGDVFTYYRLKRWTPTGPQPPGQKSALVL